MRKADSQGDGTEVSSEPVLVTRDERGVATVMLNRPDVHNAFDDSLIKTLTKTFRALGADPAVRLLILAAEGKSFSAGADLKWMRRMADFSREDNYRDSLGLAELMHTLDTVAQPVIARVQGAAIGGGVGLVACCDIAIAADSAVFALSEVRLGLTPAVISPYVLRAIGERQARRYFVTAERFDAQKALQLGLVHEVVPAAALGGRVDELTQAMRANGPQAMRAAKRLARDVSATHIDAALREETARRISDIRAGEEGREGVSAFLDKRRARWVDH